MIPVIFIQVWKPCNVKIAVKTASQSNVVHLVGDCDYSDGSCEFHNISEFKYGIAEWLKFQGKEYIVDFETLCMYRWYCVLRLMEKIGADVVWACDSDVLLYSNALSEYGRIGRPDVTLSNCPEGRRAGLDYPLGHTGHSMVKIDVLREFVGRVHTTWNDMFAWTNMLMVSKWNVVDTAKPIGNMVWDHHLGNNLKQYDSTNEMKRVRFAGGMPTVTHKNGTVYVTPVLHCWGPAESKMEQLSNRIDVI